jgi:hypothetical protein
MNTSTEVSELFSALVLCQSEIGSIEHDCVVDYTFKGKRTHFKYTSLKKILETIKPAMKQANLAIIQSPNVEGGSVTLTTRLVHSSGQWLESELTMKAPSDGAHDVAGTITYGKRYSISSLLGIACGEDNDANEIDAVYTGTEEQKALVMHTLQGGGADNETMKMVHERMIEQGMPARHDAIMQIFDEVSRG